MIYHYYGWGPFDFLGGIFQIIFWVFIIALIIRLLRGRRRWHHWMDGSHSAMSILRERYAKGEISKEEFEERKKVLGEE